MSVLVKPPVQRIRRSVVEILMEALQVVADEGNEGIKPTHILYRANLSWSVLEQFILPVLEKRQLVRWTAAPLHPRAKPKEQMTARRLYFVTPRGLSTLSEWLDLKERLGFDPNQPMAFPEGTKV